MVDILVLVKRIGNLFIEAEDLTNQLAEAVDRRDEVSINIATGMRSEPISRLVEADRALREHLANLGDDADGVRIRAILNGDSAAAQGETEKLLADQSAQNIRNYNRLMEKDKIVNQKITRDKSIYQ